MLGFRLGESGGGGSGNGDSSIKFKERLKRFGSFQGKSKSKEREHGSGREDKKLGKNFSVNTVGLPENRGIFIVNFKRKGGPS